MTFADLIHFIDPKAIISAFGVIGVIAIIFAETGLLIGFFLPGDSLLFTAGLLASQGYLPFFPLMVGTFIAAIAGDSFGYWFGKKTGPALFSREDSRFFKKQYIAQAETFYEKHGKKTIILARFLPVVRTFAPIVAGIAKMNYKTFVAFNIIGAFIWAVGLTLAGYFLGTFIPDIDKYLIPIILLIVVASFIPGIIHILKPGKNVKTIV